MIIILILFLSACGKDTDTQFKKTKQGLLDYYDVDLSYVMMTLVEFDAKNSQDDIKSIKNVLVRDSDQDGAVLETVKYTDSSIGEIAETRIDAQQYEINLADKQQLNLLETKVYAFNGLNEDTYSRYIIGFMDAKNPGIKDNQYTFDLKENGHLVVLPEAPVRSIGYVSKEISDKPFKKFSKQGSESIESGKITFLIEKRRIKEVNQTIVMNGKEYNRTVKFYDFKHKEDVNKTKRDYKYWD